jgi:membrane glycosyltransferase
LVRANELAKSSRASGSPLRQLVEDSVLFESHLTNLPDEQRRRRGQVDPHLAIARAKIEDAKSLEEVQSYLTSRELFAVLNSPTLLLVLHAMPRAA